VRSTVTAVARLAALFAIALESPTAAFATTLLTYSGPAYTQVDDSTAIAGSYDTTMSVSATIELSSALPANFNGSVVPLHFSMNDGRFTITDRFPSSAFRFVTDGSGAITSWYLEAHDTLPGNLLLLIQSAHAPAFFPSVRDLGSIATTAGDGEFGVVFAGGSWQVSVPEPASAGLLAAGLIGLRCVRRRRAK
jgi:hypothetical protein